MSILSVVLAILGIWLIIDGVGSIIEYEKQSALEQLIRVVRCGIGIALIVLGILTWT